MTVYAEAILLRALTQRGDRYIFGTEVDRLDPDPDAFDCSELVQWACEHEGLRPFPDGAANQFAYCEQHHTTISVDEALRLRGALMFPWPHVHHVVFSLGDGKHTMEAKGKRWGVNVFSAIGRFQRAARIPGATYGPLPLPAPPKPAATVDELTLPGGRGGWRLTDVGGVHAWGVAPFWGSLPGLIEHGRAHPDPTRHARQLIDRADGGYRILTNKTGQHYDFGPGVPY